MTMRYLRTNATPMYAYKSRNTGKALLPTGAVFESLSMAAVHERMRCSGPEVPRRRVRTHQWEREGTRRNVLVIKEAQLRLSLLLTVLYSMLLV